MSKAQQQYIGFPAPLLGEESKRLEVLAYADGLLALEKPPSVLVEPDPWWKGTPAMIAGLSSQAKAGKPELAPYGIKQPRGIFNSEPEVSGIALFGCTPEATAHWRDVYGSALLTLTYHFIAVSQPETEESFTIDLPLKRQEHEIAMQVSHRYGKKSATHFRLEERYSAGLSLWRAQTTYARLLQVRTHAMEAGLRIVGDEAMGGQPPLTAGELQPKLRGKGREKVYWAYPNIWLSGIEGCGLTIQKDAPHALAVQGKKMAL